MNMKNLKSILTVFLVMIGMQASAEELTLSVPQTIQAGQEFVVSIALENERTDYCAFKMDLQVSDGITFVQELNDDEELDYVVTLSADRKKSDHQLAMSLVEDNRLRIASFSSSNKTFKGNSGEIVTVKLKVNEDANSLQGISLIGAYFSTTEEKDVYMNDVSQVFRLPNPNGITIYVISNETPYIWSWGAANDEDLNVGEWPGENQLTFVWENPVNGEKFWAWEFRNECLPISFLFNNGMEYNTIQTGDIAGVNSDRFFYLNLDKGYCEDVSEAYGIEIPDAEVNKVTLAGNHNGWDGANDEFEVIEEGKVFRLTVDLSNYSIDDNLWRFKFRPNGQDWLGYSNVECYGDFLWEEDDNFVIDLEEMEERKFTFTLTWGGGKHADQNWKLEAVAVRDMSNIVVTEDYYLNTNDSIYNDVKNINVAMRSQGNNYWYPYNYNFGALTVSGENMLSVDNFQMAYAPYVQYITKNYGYNGRRASAVLINSAPMRADTVAINMTLMANMWQFISLPFDIKVADINWANNDQLYAIYKYDGKKRADQDMQNTWVRMTADSTLQAGVGYIWQVANSYDEETGYSEIIRCELKARNNGNKNNIFVNSNTEVKMAEYLSEFVQDRSWNLLGNPYPAYFASRAMDITSPFTVWNLTQQNYEAYSPMDDDYVFAPGEAFFFQRPLDQATITFLKEGRQTDGYSYGRVFFNGARQSEMTAKRYVFNLTLSGNELSDRTRFVINEEASLTYEMDKDASKFASMNANAVQLYTVENGVRYAINERPLGKGEIVLGMSIAKKGTYTLKLDTQVENEVILMDRLTGTEVLLNEDGYTFTAEAGKIDSRFVVRLVSGETTGISFTPILSEGKGVVYDLQGRRVKSQLKSGLYIHNGKKVVVK